MKVLYLDITHAIEIHDYIISESAGLMEYSILESWKAYLNTLKTTYIILNS